MKNETARREIESLDYYLQNHTNDYSEESHTAMMMAIDALGNLENLNNCDLISRQEVIEQTYKWSKDEFLRVTNPFDYLRKRINSLSSVNPQEPKTGWIPVSERLPKNRNQEVLINLEWGIDIGRYSDGEWHSEWINHFDDGNVIAWMPLPKPYKPQERSE